MKISSPDATLPLSLVVDGTYVKIWKSPEALHILWTISTTTALTGGANYTVIQIVNIDGTSTNITLPTTFSSTLINKFFILPLSCLSLTLITNAGAGSG